MSLYYWAECNRAVLGEILPEALVVLPIGATEQHGPHLPTGTDSIVVESVVVQGVQRAAGAAVRDIVLAPTIPFGASDHHFLFGGTLSLESETTTQVLVDLIRSVKQDGGSRVLIVNGHGGNRGPCHSATHIASTRYGVHAAYIDYWSLVRNLGDGVNVPGHAGAFETGMMRHLRPQLLADVPPGEDPRSYPDIEDMVLHTEVIWRSLDGYTDHPVRATVEAGARWFNACADALADRIAALAASL
jgi:creatinine amidohydrolase